MPYSQNTVLETPELFESILLQLPQVEILRVQIVCSKWKDTITASPTIQHKLFLRPISNHNHPPELNPLLQVLFPPLFTLDKLILEQLFSGLEAIPPQDDMVSQMNIRALSWFTDPRLRSAVLREDASWRKMFPVQPPARISKIVEGGGCRDTGRFLEHGYPTPDFQYLQEHGARMGLIYDILIQGMMRLNEGTVSIEWCMFPLTLTWCEWPNGSPQLVHKPAENLKENTITLYLGYSCSTCDYSHRGDEEWDASRLQIAPFDENLIEMKQIAEDP